MAQRGGARPGAGRKPGKVSAAKRELAEMAKDHAEDALKTLVSIAKSTSASEAARVSAAVAILDRGYGKPRQSVEVDGALTGAMTVQYVKAAMGPTPEPSPEDYET